MKFFGIPKNATSKSLFVSAVVQGLFTFGMFELSNRGDYDMDVMLNNWLGRMMIFGGFIFIPLGVAAYWYQRAAALIGVSFYAAFLAVQASRGAGMVVGLAILNVPMVILLVFALVCALRRPSVSPAAST